MSELASLNKSKDITAVLSRRAVQWLATLDEKIRPKLLPEQYPRIINRIEEVWADPQLARAYFDDLMTESRGTRSGFSDEALAELSALKHHYDRVLFPAKGDMWTSPKFPGALSEFVFARQTVGLKLGFWLLSTSGYAGAD